MTARYFPHHFERLSRSSYSDRTKSWNNWGYTNSKKCSWNASG
jgi:hypothetical protein